MSEAQAQEPVIKAFDVKTIGVAETYYGVLPIAATETLIAKLGKKLDAEHLTQTSEIVVRIAVSVTCGGIDKDSGIEGPLPDGVTSVTRKVP